MVKPQSHSKPQNQAGEDNRLYRGVRVRKWGKWVAEVRRLHSRERIWLGSFETAEEAARAYDAGALCTRGPNTDFNFPNDLPPLQPSGFMPTVQIQLEAAKHAGNIVNTQLRLGPPCMADNVDVAGVGVGDGGGGGDGDDGLRCPEKPFFKFI